jgi:MFS transporter, PPP family, 3-phenylpropionic acid transporter
VPLSFRLASFYFTFFSFAGVYVAYFPPYLASRGLSAGEIAWVIALPQIARVFAPAGWGWLADRSGAQRGIVVFSCAANMVCFAALPFAASFVSIAALVAACSVLSAGALPLVEAITLGSLAASPGRYGPIRLWGSAAFAAVVFGGGFWLDVRTVDAVPLGMAAFSLASLAAALWLPRGQPQAHQAASFQWTAPMLALLGAGFCMAMAHGALYAFFTLHLQREGYSGALIGFLWTLGVLAEMLVFVLLPLVFRRYSLSAILLASLGCAVLRFLAIGWGAAELAILVVAQLLHAATFGAFHAASVAAVHRVFPSGAHGRGQTLFSSLAYGAGGAAGALVAGWSWQAGGPAAAFTGSAVAALAGIFLAFQLKRANV